MRRIDVIFFILFFVLLTYSTQSVATELHYDMYQGGVKVGTMDLKKKKVGNQYHIEVLAKAESEIMFINYSYYCYIRAHLNNELELLSYQTHIKTIGLDEDFKGEFKNNSFILQRKPHSGKNWKTEKLGPFTRTSLDFFFASKNTELARSKADHVIWHSLDLEEGKVKKERFNIAPYDPDNTENLILLEGEKNAFFVNKSSFIIDRETGDMIRSIHSIMFIKMEMRLVNSR